jgi:cell division protein FtsX
MIEAVKSNSIPPAILIEERTHDNLHSDINICEAQNVRQINEIKKFKSDLSCHKYCYKYDDIIQLGGIIIFVFIIGIFVLIQMIIQIQ